MMGDTEVFEAWNDGTGAGAHDLVESLPSAIGGEGRRRAEAGAWDAARGGRKQVLLARGREAKLGVFFPGGRLWSSWRNRDGRCHLRWERDRGIS